jgi:hypothetical protein
MSGFTPGPWAVRAGANRSGRYEIEAGAQILCPGTGGARSYSDVVAATHWSGTPEWEANAHLIAAAPEMYEALKHLHKWFEITGSSINARWGRIPPEDSKIIVDAMRAALAKAEGTSS